jgi:PKD domain
MKALKTLAALATIALAACTQQSAQEQPPLTGPSGPATSIRVTATPDTIAQDGSAVSTIAVTVLKAGLPQANLEVRFDMTVDGIATEFGTFLPGRTARTDASGLATVTYMSPPKAPVGRVQTCDGLPGTCVVILATPTGSDFEFSQHPSVRIRLAPPSVLLPPPDPAAPTASFIVVKNPVKTGEQAIFNATSSKATAGRTIISYEWDFGDGTHKSGVTTSHDFDDDGVYIVTLTVTDNFGLKGVFTSPITVVP